VSADVLAIHHATVVGDVVALRAAVGDPADFPNCRGPMAIGDSLLIYAVYHGPVALVRELLDLGAEVNPAVEDGFPTIVALMSTARPDKHELLGVLLAAGADVDARGVNDQTALRWAVAAEDLRAAELLLSHGADPHLKTRIDDLSSPLEDAERIAFITGRPAMADLLRSHAGGSP
jgi:ankyrin repeat protein